LQKTKTKTTLQPAKAAVRWFEKAKKQTKSELKVTKTHKTNK
jgi:hypothetical protein